MAIKLLISGESNSGKTTLTKDLKDTLVVSHDGKSYPFPVPHYLIADFSTVSDLIEGINEKVKVYKEKFKKLPKTIVFDSISKIFDTILNNCNEKYKGFAIYTELDKEIHELMDYIQNTIIASGINVIVISHAIYDSDISKYILVGKGSFNKRGGVLSEVDEAIFIETKANKRIVHFRSTKLPARTLVETLPDSQPVEDFNLQSHIELLESKQAKSDEYAL